MYISYIQIEPIIIKRPLQLHWISYNLISLLSVFVQTLTDVMKHLQFFGNRINNHSIALDSNQNYCYWLWHDIQLKIYRKTQKILNTTHGNIPCHVAHINPTDQMEPVCGSAPAEAPLLLGPRGPCPTRTQHCSHMMHGDSGPETDDRDKTRDALQWNEPSTVWIKGQKPLGYWRRTAGLVQGPHLDPCELRWVGPGTREPRRNVNTAKI